MASMPAWARACAHNVTCNRRIAFCLADTGLLGGNARAGGSSSSIMHCRKWGNRRAGSRLYLHGIHVRTRPITLIYCTIPFQGPTRAALIRCAGGEIG